MIEDKVKILGVGIDNITSGQLNKLIVNKVSKNDKAIISNVNVHAMNIAFNLSWFKNFLNKAEINFCDGDGVRLGARILGSPIKEKITYNRWIWELAKISAKYNLSWYITGSKESVINKAYEVLRRDYPLLNIKGFHHGYLNDTETNEKLISDINFQNPNILIVGMGMPLQEKWLLNNYNDLNFNIALTGGAVFEYISGSTKMTPDIFFKLKLEWFYRFLQEPKRLFRRYFVGNPLFILRVIKEKIGILRF